MMRPGNFVYSSLDNLLEIRRLDPVSGELALVQSTAFDEVVQHAWPNRARTQLYVVTSGSGPMAETKAPNHFAQAFSILADGTIEPLQEPCSLRNRPLFVMLDREERHMLAAYNDPSDVTVHKVGVGGTIGEEVLQSPLYFGRTAHQVRVTPTGNIVVVPACAHERNGVPAGCVDLFDFKGGQLSPHSRISADPARSAKWRGIENGAQGFSARHVEFHPTRPWMYLVVETQGELHQFDYDEAGVSLTPRFVKSTLKGAPVGRSAQLASAVHAHPNGHFIYVTNRALDSERQANRDVFLGGANTIAAFKIDPSTGEPTLI